MVGAGRMAEIRADALAAVDGVELCGIAARRRSRAEEFAARFGIPVSTDDYRELASTAPDALLAEVPHQLQDDVVRWALRSGMHVLAGGSLAATRPAAREIAALAAEYGLVVEAGYEARYKRVWHAAAEMIHSGALGELLAVQTIALVDQDPRSWYYDEEASGGMFVTHVSYAFLNPLRWILGTPETVAAIANRKALTRAGAVRHETCAILLTFPGDVLCTMTASYVRPPGMDAWDVRILGTDGALDLRPGDLEPGGLRHHPRRGPSVTRDFASNDAFARQAAAFVAACRGTARVRNPAGNALIDIELCHLLAASADEGGTPLSTTAITAPDGAVAMNASGYGHRRRPS
ncbi:Gfo/Idh/MocA family protein [Micromonospora sp. RB23]